MYPVNWVADLPDAARRGARPPWTDVLAFAERRVPCRVQTLGRALVVRRRPYPHDAERIDGVDVRPPVSAGVAAEPGASAGAANSAHPLRLGLTAQIRDACRANRMLVAQDAFRAC